MSNEMNSSMQSALLLAAGGYNLAFALFHMSFWRLFQWPASLTSAGRLNSAVTQTLNIVLTYVFLAAAARMIFLWTRGQEATLLLLAGAGFWALRAALQPLLFARNSNLSRAMTGIFVAGAVLHASPLVLST
jgi:hypothetical protein